MTNPDNIVRVRARNGGRASVYEANGWAQAYKMGLLSGNGVTQNTSADMNVLVGGSTSKPDVLIAENPSGYKVALDVVGQQAVAITAPATNSRISAIVAYTDDLSLATTEDTVTGSPASCGLIVVNGTAAVNPSEPTDAQIRTAITADGATGSQAAYCVIATILVASSATIITNSLITIKGAGGYSYEEVNTGEVWVDGSPIYRKTISVGNLPNATTKSVAHNISNFGVPVQLEGMCISNAGSGYPMNGARPSNNSLTVSAYVSTTNINIETAADRRDWTGYVTVWYTKTS